MNAFKEIPTPEKLKDVKNTILRQCSLSYTCSLLMLTNISIATLGSNCVCITAAAGV